MIDSIIFASLTMPLFYLAYRHGQKQSEIKAIEKTLDFLIEEGYLESNGESILRKSNRHK